MNKPFILMLLLFSSTAFADDLTGRWRGNDGGIYYITQIDNRLVWYGQDSRRRPVWSNVFNGRVHGRHIRGRWVDVPKGHTLGDGRLELKIRRHGNVMVVIKQTGGFSATRLKRIRRPRPQSYYRDEFDSDYNQSYDQFEEEHSRRQHEKSVADATTSPNECFTFNPRQLTVEYIDGGWKLLSGEYFLEDFANRKGEAQTSMAMIKHYRMNEFCSVGGLNTEFKYLLSHGKVPVGKYFNEYCVRFRRHRLRMRNINGHWKIGDGNFWMFDFGNQRRDAKRAISIMKKYPFRYACYVGNQSTRHFRYFRR